MYNLNINKSSVVPTNLIVGRVADKPYDKVEFKIFDGVEPMDLTGYAVEFRGTTPDDKKVFSKSVTVTNVKQGEIEFVFPQNFYSAKGHFKNAYFRLTKGSNSESTNDILINVLNAVDVNVEDAQVITDEFDELRKEADKIQKQLDELKKALDGTDVQRPQITRTNGGDFAVNDKNRSTTELLKELGSGLKYVYVQSTKDAPESYIMGIASINVGKTVITFEGSAVISGNAYSFAHLTGTDKGWQRLDNKLVQQQKVTKDNGDELIRLDDPNLESFQAFRHDIKNGLQSVYLRQLKDAPAQPLIGHYVATHGGVDGTFIGTRMTTGEVYSYAHNGTSGRWTQLDNVNIQQKKITTDGGDYFAVSQPTKTMEEVAKESGNKYRYVALVDVKGLPSPWIFGTMFSNGNVTEVYFEGINNQGQHYTYSTSKGWKKTTHDGQASKITADSGAYLIDVPNGKDVFTEIGNAGYGFKTIIVRGGATNSPDKNRAFLGTSLFTYGTMADKVREVTIDLKSNNGDTYNCTRIGGIDGGWTKLNT